MIRFSSLQKTALSLPEVTGNPHVENIAFRGNTPLFASYDTRQRGACIKLSGSDEYVCFTHHNSIIFTDPNPWKKQDRTLIAMQQVLKEMFADALKTPYCAVATHKRSALIKKNT